MFKWLQQPGQVTKQPLKVTIGGVTPGSELAHAVVHAYRAQINHFHRTQNQNYSLSPVEITKKRGFYPIGRVAAGTGEVREAMVPGAIIDRASSTGATDQVPPGLAMTYTNQFGRERIDIEVTGNLLNEMKEKIMIRPERDIELRGYICIHNANIGSTVQTTSEAAQQWELRLNSTAVGGSRTYAPGEAVVFCIDGFRPNYHSVNDGSNPFGAVGQPVPGHPGQDHSIAVQYPMFGINPTNPVMTAFLGSDIVDQNIITGSPAGPITYVDISSDGLINLLGLNEAEVFQTSPPPNVSATSYALIYAEFFGRYAREVESSWRFPRADIGGVARKILINDDPVFRGSDFGAPATSSGYIGGIRLDLRPPNQYANENDAATQGGVLSESLVGPKYTFLSSTVDGYPISLFDPWP